jgi:flagellar hook assembly protein FlgD
MNNSSTVSPRHPTGFRRGLLVFGACQLFLATVSLAADIAFTLDKPGRVSLAIYDTKGIQVRTLRNAEPLEAGKHTIVWDGLDRNGQPAPAGDYTWKLLESQGLQAEYLMALGTGARRPHRWP